MERTRVYSKVKQLVLLFFFMFPVLGDAQTIEISGTVLDSGKTPIIGASVLEKGTTNGIITDIDGNFTLSVSPNGTLSISYVGYQTQEIHINGKTVFNITLKEDNELLDEVIVVGYGTMKKSDMTGAISSVDVEELTKRATTNPAEALQGKIAGVNIMKAGGNAGAGVSVKIRGVKSFGDNEPLYIIDGFPGDINNVNPSDIQSMEVLKDGAAAAIYGSVAANGVVIITTKNGKKGDTKIDFNTYISFTNVAKKLELLNAAEYKQVHKQMFENYIADNPGTDVTIPAFVTNESSVDTDWQDAMMRKGLSQNYMISIRGGSDNALYSISYNHADEKGIFLGNDYKQDNARMKLHMKKSIFDFDANFNFKYTNSNQPQYSLKEMYMISPLVPIYNENEESGFGLTNFDGLPNNRNVMADHYYQKATDQKYHTSGNIAITINFTDYLNFKTSYSYRGEHQRETSHAPSYTADPKSKQEYPYNSETTAYWEEQVFDNVLNFNKQFGKHNLNLMAGTSVTARKYTWNSVGVEGKTTVYKVEDGNLVTNEIPAGFLDQSFATIDAGAGGTYDGSGSKWDYNRASFFGRVNYNYNDRYLIQATVRWDGSSKFGVNNRWGFFPSVALGWRISQEEFFPKDSFINNLKLRASWGQLGNENALGYYDFLALISTYNTMYQGYVRGNGDNAWTGSVARALENKSLKWETTDSKNIGIDFGLFNNRLNGSFNYYYSQTRDLLITKVLAPSAGLDNPILNVGKMSNKGIEIELNWNDKINDFNYSIGANLTTTKNKVLELANEGQTIYGEGLKYGTEHFPTQTKVGKPIGAFYLYKTDGIFQSMEEINQYVNNEGELLQPEAKPGDIKFLDMNNDGTIDEDDKVYCGSGIPALEANLNFSADYKGFDLSLVLGSAWNYKLYNGNKYFYEGMNSSSNMLKSTLNAWTPTNTDTDVPRAIYQDSNGNTRESDRFLENGNFVRLRQLQLGYTLPSSLTKKVYIEKLRFYVSGENLFTITAYDGIDPEFSRSNVLNTGIDKLIYPFTRSFTVGAQLTF
ncbi:TonB-dependent receptor [Bacteroides sp. ET336]|uniref:SusC/RagA family TonB-linked outer membrane protein n=1 Tax=Bacteroides sp. ET336 TaxID=2972459 RepID=UPI0021AD07BF|nr:TonB-dependent receptor [Bacteroides sp. ET336]MCR8894411.1 TonB-dependent receptor [Bacteroides sp. ET336]MDN0058907.1 TonB-dependent receptor [Bacteroides caecigallinarum]